MISYIILHCTLVVLSHMRSKPTWLAISYCIAHCLHCLTWGQSQHDWLYTITLRIVSIVSREVKANMIGYIILHCTLLVMSHMRSKPTWLAISYYIAHCQYCLTWGQSQHDWLYNITFYIVSIVSHEVKANMIGLIILHWTLLVLSHMRSKPTWLAI